MAAKIRKGDKVVVLTGRDKGRTGEVFEVRPDAGTALAVLEDAALRESLAACAISETVGFRKPRREIFEAVAAPLGAAPDEVLHVGDNLSDDVGGASVLGMRTVWLTREVVRPRRSAVRPKCSSSASTRNSRSSRNSTSGIVERCYTPRAADPR